MTSPSGAALTRLRRRSREVLREQSRGLRASARAAGHHHLGAYPDFLILGAMRCGTTSLFHCLAQHPRIETPTGKELQYFTLHHHRGDRWYRAHFPAPAPGRLTFEASPYYLFHPDVPAAVARTMPDARFLVLLRDPIDRAYSHYLHTRDRGYEPLGFADALEAEQERLSAGRSSSGSGQRGSQDPLRLYSYLARGHYAEQLERWFDHLPPVNFHVMRSEDFFTTPGPVLDGVLGFLDLPPDVPHVWRRQAANRPAAPIAPDLRAQLHDHFAPHNDRLATLLGWTRTW